MEIHETPMGLWDRSKLSSALSEELCDATSRMRSRSMWEGGGRAEVSDAWYLVELYSEGEDLNYLKFSGQHFIVFCRFPGIEYS